MTKVIVRYRKQSGRVVIRIQKHANKFLVSVLLA